MILRNNDRFAVALDVRPICIELTERLEIPVNEGVIGVTKLRNEIYILCRSRIHVFEDRTPFCLQQEIEIKTITSVFDIGSCKKEYCLYISNFIDRCVWKIKIETDYKHKIFKWLITGYNPRTLSVSSDGQLMMVNNLSSSLMIYGSDAELIRSIQLPIEIKNPQHAVETSIGNIIIIHTEKDEVVGEADVRLTKEDKDHLDRKVGKRVSSVRQGTKKLIVSELTRDGQIVIRRLIPSTETHEVNDPAYLSIDSDDRVFVSDYSNNRVILLDSDLQWNRILCPTSEENEDTRILLPNSLCYDEEMKQLIVGGEFRNQVNLYTLSRI